MRIFAFAFFLSMWASVLAAPTPYAASQEAAGLEVVLPHRLLTQSAASGIPSPYMPPPGAEREAMIAAKKKKEAKKNRKAVDIRVQRALAKNREQIRMRRRQKLEESEDVEERTFLF